MTVSSWFRTFNLKPEARRELEARTRFWALHAWLRLLTCVTASVCAILTYASYSHPSDTIYTDVLWCTAVWSFANLMNLLVLQAPMPAAANITLDILGSIGMVLNSESAIGSVSVAGSGSWYAIAVVTSVFVCLACAGQLLVSILDCVVCHLLRRHREWERKQNPIAMT